MQVLLEAGDLLILGGSSRWEWCHEIKSVVEVSQPQRHSGMKLILVNSHAVKPY